jgi:hypothetical protein
MLGNTTSEAVNFLADDFTQRVMHILNAPFRTHNMLWMLVPLLATAILLEFYFGRYKEEELGWNTAFGNAIVLSFVAIDLFRQTYEPMGVTLQESIISGNPKLIISIVIFAFAMLLLFIDFFHILPKKIAYALSSPVYMNILGLLGIIIVYSQDIPLDTLTLVACFIILIAFTLATYLIYFIVPCYHPPIKRMVSEPSNDANIK